MGGYIYVVCIIVIIFFNFLAKYYTQILHKVHKIDIFIANATNNINTNNFINYHAPQQQD